MTGEPFGPAGVVVYEGPPHTDGWHAARRGGIGASDIPAIIGFSRWSSAYDVWLEKTGRPGAPRSDALDEAAAWGLRLEDLVAGHFAETTGLDVVRPNVVVANVEMPWARCSPDGIAGGDALLELKCRSAYQSRDWLDEPPDDVALQAQWQMLVTGYPRAWIAALVGGNRFRRYPVEADPELHMLLAEQAEAFLGYVQRDEPPPPDSSDACSRALARLWTPDDEQAVELDDSLGDAYVSTRPRLVESIAAAQAEVDLIDNRLRAAMGAATVATYGGRKVATWRRNGTFAPSVFAAENPDLFEEYLRPAPALDVDALKQDHPDVWARYRARALRQSKRGGNA